MKLRVEDTDERAATERCTAPIEADAVGHAAGVPVAHDDDGPSRSRDHLLDATPGVAAGYGNVGRNGTGRGSFSVHRSCIRPWRRQRGGGQIR